MRLRFVVAMFAIVCGCLVAAATAAAKVTSSNLVVTSPSGTYLIDDTVTPHEAISVSGTTETTDGNASDSVDINCYSGTSWAILAQSVPVQSDGSFSFTSTTGLAGLWGETCVLRAVNAGDTTDYAPGTSSPFTGPTLAIDHVENRPVSGGPNSGDLESYYLYASQLQGGFDYDSLGDCSISDSYIYDPVTFASTTLDFCNAWFWWENGGGGTPFATPTRSELQVDGADAYVAGNVGAIGPFGSTDSGFPSLAYSYSIDPATGNLTLDETDEVVRCSPGGVFPPTSTSCASLAPTGVQVKMHIVQSHDGRVATVTQYFSSTDGRSHTVGLLEDNEFEQNHYDGELNFPWTGSGFTSYTTPGQVIAGPSAGGPASFFVEGSASAPASSGYGGVTFSNPPDSETIIDDMNHVNYSWVDLHYSRTVPATGSVALAFTYSNAFAASDVAADATAAEAAFRPAVAIAAPANGSSTSKSSVVVSGTASDATGLSSLTVNGLHVPVASNGSWSETIPLSKGANTITAFATNVFGNTAQAHTTVSYVPVVPVVIPAPVLSQFTQSHRKWREKGHPRRHKPPVGTVFTLSVDQPAAVKFTFTEKLTGRRVKGRCVALMRRNRHNRACSRTVPAGRFSVAGKAGSNKVSFKGAIPERKRLRPGRYTVTAVAVNSAGKRSQQRQLTFTIVK